MGDVNHRGTEAQRRCGSENHTFYAITQNSGIEVDQKTGLDSAEPQVTQKLGIMYRRESVNGLKFDNQTFLNNKIQPKSCAYGQPFVLKRHTALSRKTNATEFKFFGQAHFVDGFQKSRTHGAIDFHCAANNSARQRVTVSRLYDIIHKIRHAMARGKIYNIAQKSLCLCASVPLWFQLTVQVVTPAKAGVQQQQQVFWIPACAGMT
ncbi:MAG: hypothetical protein NWR87_08355 [Rhodospirillales bacterium]|nr:hypothetical protein [Rhodospirillales bacterium]